MLGKQESTITLVRNKEFIRDSTKTKLIGDNIEQVLVKDLRGVEVIHSYKVLHFRRVTNKIKKKMTNNTYNVNLFYQINLNKKTNKNA